MSNLVLSRFDNEIDTLQTGPNHQTRTMPKVLACTPPKHPRAFDIIGQSQPLAMLVGLVVTASMLVGCQSSKTTGGSAAQPGTSDAAMYPPAPTKEYQAALSPQDALAKLRAGNARFVAGQSNLGNLAGKVSDADGG